MFLLTNAYADDDVITVNETEKVAQPSESSTFSTLSSIVPMLLIFVVFYFFLIRPQEKRRREKESLVNSVKKGEEVITNGGIFGVISKVNDSDNTVDLQIAENINIKILKAAISDLPSRNNTKSKEPTDKKSKKKG